APAPRVGAGAIVAVLGSGASPKPARQAQQGCCRSAYFPICNLSSHPVDTGDSGTGRRVAFAEKPSVPEVWPPKTTARDLLPSHRSPVFAGDRRRAVQVGVIWESAGSNYVAYVQLSW